MALGNVYLWSIVIYYTLCNISEEIGICITTNAFLPTTCVTNPYIDVVPKYSMTIFINRCLSDAENVQRYKGGSNIYKWWIHYKQLVTEL